MSIKLPPNWTEYTDPETRDPYYYNSVTKRSEWTLTYITVIKPGETFTVKRADLLANIRAKSGETAYKYWETVWFPNTVEFTVVENSPKLNQGKESILLKWKDPNDKLHDTEFDRDFFVGLVFPPTYNVEGGIRKRNTKRAAKRSRKSRKTNRRK